MFNVFFAITRLNGNAVKLANIMEHSRGYGVSRFQRHHNIQGADGFQ